MYSYFKIIAKDSGNFQEKMHRSAQPGKPWLPQAEMAGLYC
jgi:hypothetical protein